MKPTRRTLRYRDNRTWRRRYRGSRAYDASCRCHGGCGWCLGNRMHKHRRSLAMLEAKPC